MIRRTRGSLVLAVAAAVALAGGRATRADDAAPEKPPARAPAAAAPSAEARESRVMLALLKATGRVMVSYLDEKRDPEKAAAYEDILRALGGVLTHLDPGDERAAVAAGMKAVLDLMPTMNDPKRAAVMRGVLMTMAHAVAEGLEAGSATEGAAARPQGKDATRALADAVLGGVADGMLAEISSQTFFGARLGALAAGREGFPVTAVRSGSRAEELGLRTGDTIVRIQGAPATWRTLFAAALALHRDGEFPPLTVLRDGKPVDLTPRPAAVPPCPSPPVAPAPDPPAPKAGPR